ncbi:MAG: ATP synthase F1 subunit delta [Leptolyngbya sp. PLA1]|nr:ATP synthase F1 subunit delta [Leptolyngbya sp. PLA1]
MPLQATQTDAVARMYARSLYELADAKGGRAKVEEIASELEEILEIARSNGAFSEFLASRSLSATAREGSLGRIFKGRVTDLTLNFLLVLNEKGRIGSLATIVAAFDSILQDKFGRVEVDVYTASPLSPDAAAGLRTRLGKTLGKEVVLHPYTEPAMIGGVKFRIGDQLVDGSVATRLRQVQERIGSSGAAEIRARISRIIEGE